VDEESLLIWKMSFPGTTLPTVSNLEAIEPGGIDAGCFAFHIKHKDSCQWHAQRAGDYHCFNQLRSRLKPMFMEDILTRINYEDRMGGQGLAEDISPDC
jgi:hypothetical protein